MSGIPALLSVVNLLVDGFNDASNLFGQKKSVSSFTAFGNLIPDVLGMCGTVGDLPTEIKKLSAADINSVVQTVAQRLQISGVPRTMIAMSYPSLRWGWNPRSAARVSRLSRLRSTAFPLFFPAITV